jgi:propionyl-CoA carboxylase beta chain
MMLRELLSFIPSNNMEDPPLKPCTDSVRREDEKLQTIIPDDPNKPYDIKEIITTVVDDHNFFEVMPYYAQNMIIGFARFGGRPVGIVANQPANLAGVLDINSSLKGARFVRFCDAFNIPLVTFVDVPGFLPGTAQEFGGIIKHGAKLLYAFAEATVPKVTLITRKAYGGAYDVMSSKHIGADVNFAYPTAEIAVMGPEGAVNIIFRDKLSDEDKKKAVEEYKNTFASPYKAAALGYIDEIIFPKETRFKIVQALEMTQNKSKSHPPKKHGNIPL